MIHRIPCFFLVYLIAAISTNVVAGNDNPPVGARAQGLSGAAVTIADMWALSNNPAALALLKNTEVGAYAENRFSVKAFSTVDLQAVKPFNEKFGTAGLEFYRFGDDLYSEQRVGAGFGHKLGFVSLGIKADLVQVHVADIGTKRAVAVSFGGLDDVSEQLKFGAYVYNLNQAKLAEEQDERLPTVMKAGLSYRPVSRLMLNIESEKNIDFPAEFKAGLEYKVIEKLAARAGFSTTTESVSLGAGWMARVFQVDYAVNLMSKLGASNHLSVSYRFL
ncbi:MAG: hypothetical protein LPJ89_02065 [Hymenobacteraceae bacterium]|nr:hypothetical protein [Hymenobacteraceae bacterium]